MPVADTSFVIDLMRREAGALRLSAGFEREGIPLATTAITAMELLKGAYLSDNRDNLVKARTVLDLFIVLAVDETMYEVYGRLAAGLSRAGTPVGDFDEIIAAMTLCHDGKIITRDRHFEKIPGLSVITY